jgi:hypothetical protein
MKRIVQIVTFALVLCGLTLSFAQEPPKKGDEGWQSVNGDMLQPGESIPASRLVGAAYGFICCAVIVWVASVARRARRLEDEVDDLKKKLQAR